MGSHGTLRPVAVPEKTLAPPQFLSLTERVDLRRRVVLFSRGARGVAVFPAWDMDGPDLPYFADFDERGDRDVPVTAMRAGPWIVDGRLIVADMKDRVLQAIEAAATAWPRATLALHVVETVPHAWRAARGWDFGAWLWTAFWSGVRKARDALPSDLAARVRISAVTPSTAASPFAWQDPAARILNHVSLDASVAASEAEVNIAMIGCDPFAMLGSTPLEAETFRAWIGLRPDAASAMATMGARVFVSRLPAARRHPLWTPAGRLSNVTNRSKGLKTNHVHVRAVGDGRAVGRSVFEHDSGHQ